ncbi:MAG: GNAT family N-acetyltransferase [Chloroflexi bacterium]|nr:GNAT family N-acetyltransferase [Chloroflexota bacterium]
MQTITPTITTKNLTLRPLTMDDLEAMFRVFSEQGMLKYFPNPNPPTIDRAQRMIETQIQQWEQYGLGSWGVVPHGETELAGWNGLQYLPETNETEVGYMLSRKFWGRGYSTEGARAGLEFGFKTLRLDQIIGLVHPENIASQRVLIKCGMTFTYQASYFGMDMFRYQITRAEFIAPP